MAACRQGGINHYVLPKFAKGELCKHFKVRRITSFAFKLDGLPQSIAESIEDELKEFN